MKCLIGVESEEGLRASLQMLKGLVPKDLEIELLSVVDCAKSYPGYGLLPTAEMPGTLVNALEESSKELLAWSDRYAKEQGFAATSKHLWGAVSQSLLDEADSFGADLIAVHRRSVSGLGRILLGSVSRAVLLGARASVLVTKGEPAPAKEVSAVFGIDHSQYSYKCVDLFSRFELSGIKHLTFVSAWETQTGYGPHSITPAAVIRDESDALKAKFEAQNKALCDRFAALGIDCKSMVLEGPPNDVLRDAMNETQADLMIVGAQGHGFIERVLIGSTSLHQVAVETYPVLVLRI